MMFFWPGLMLSYAAEKAILDKIGRICSMNSGAVDSIKGHERTSGSALAVSHQDIEVHLLMGFGASLNMYTFHPVLIAEVCFSCNEQRIPTP